MLIFPNGTAYFGEQGAQNDIDDKGLPVEATAPTDGVPCFIEANGEDRKGRNEDGAYPHGAYTVSVDYDSVDVNSFSPKTVTLTQDHKGELGSFPVQRVEFYEITRTVKVWV